MDGRRRGPDGEVRLKNRKEDVAHQRELNLLDAQHRYALKKLRQRKESLLAEHRRILLLKVCEPKATVNRNMAEIAKHKKAGADSRRSRTSDGVRPHPGEPPDHPDRAEEPEPEPKRSGSALAKPAGSERSLSILQLRNIAAIDSISQREKAAREQSAREAMLRIEYFQRELLHQRVRAFIEKLGRYTESE